MTDTADDKPRGAAAVKLVVDNPQRRLEPLPPVDDDATRPPGPPDDGEPTRGALLPRGCPVRPLGKKEGICYYLDALDQLREIPEEKHTRSIIEGLFGQRRYLLFSREYGWARMKQNKETQAWYADGWRPELGAGALMETAARKGLWDPLGRVRGIGAWRGDDGELVLNCGSQVLVDHEWHGSGEIGRYVYPAKPGVLRPADKFIKADDVDNPAQILLKIYQSWAWRRGELDARLLLGWQCAGLLGGAINFRPVAWITGRRGSGKTTLLDAQKNLFGEMLVQSADPSPAYIWQKLKYSSVPVLVDEQEPDGRTPRQAGLIKLARLAASGSSLGRGGSDHEPEEFIARSAFMFSSILVPPLTNQDRSRIAILELLELGDHPTPDLSLRRMGKLGADLFRRLVNNWHRFDETAELLRASLRSEGHDARGADVFGTLLACLDLALSDTMMDSDEASSQAMQLRASRLAETAEQSSDEEQVLHFLGSTLLPRNAPLARAAGDLARDAASEHMDTDWHHANNALMNYGMKVLREGPRASWRFIIANQHAELYKLFGGTQWETPAGLRGIWVQALRRLPDAKPTEPLHFAGGSSRATSIPLSLVVTARDPQDTAPANQRQHKLDDFR